MEFRCSRFGNACSEIGNGRPRAATTRVYFRIRACDLAGARRGGLWMSWIWQRVCWIRQCVLWIRQWTRCLVQPCNLPKHRPNEGVEKPSAPPMYPPIQLVETQSTLPPAQSLTPPAMRSANVRTQRWATLRQADPCGAERS